MSLIKIVFLLIGFCIINTNAVFDADGNRTCYEILEDPTFAFNDLQLIECRAVKIYDIKREGNKLKFTWKNPAVKFPEYVEMNKTEEVLFNGNTKVYFTGRGDGDDADDWHHLEMKPLKEFLSGFDGVTLYHNYEARAAVMLYRRNSRYVVEGIIGKKILRHVPDGDPIDDSKYIYAYIAPLNSKEMNREFYLDPYVPEYFNLSAKHLTRVHVSLMPVIDGRILNYGIIHPHTIIKPILSYFNYIDMLFGTVTFPIISFTIKGLIVPKTDKFLPFIDRNDSVPTTIYLSHIHAGLSKFMENQKSYFGLSPYDIVLFMTGRRIFDDVTVSDGSIASTTFFKRSICEPSVYPMVIFSVHSDFINDYLLWHLISKFGTTKSIKHELKTCKNFQADYIRMNGRKRTYLPWISQCTANILTDYFKTHDCSFFQKKKIALE